MPLVVGFLFLVISIVSFRLPPQELGQTRRETLRYQRQIAVVLHLFQKTLNFFPFFRRQLFFLTVKNVS